VVGVLPPSFEVVATTTQPDLLLPLIATPAWLREGGMNYTVIGRLRSGSSRAQIDDDMKSVFQRYISTYPGVLDDKYDAGVDVRSFQEIFAGNLAPALWILLGATGFVFVLACANVVNIVLARTAGRQREFAIRSALGSGRGRIVRQVILEMLVLGAISAICAVLISLVALRGIVGLMSGSLLRASQLAPDWRVLTFVVVSGAFATMVIGIGAAVFATRLDVAGNLAASARKGGLGGSGRRLRNMLVTSESALAMVLLSGAGLLITSFSRVVQVDAGFRREGIFTASIAHTPRSYRSAVQINEFDRRVLERLRSTPGILSAAATASLPLKRGLNIPTTVLGHPDLTEGATEWRGVSTDYFRTMDVSLITGRDFTESDVTGAPRVAIVSTSYVKQFLPGENPIGKRIQIGIYKGQGPDSIASEIIGVAPDLRDQSLESKRYRNTVWTPIAQGNPMGVSVPAFVVHASDAAGAANALRTAIAEADARMGTPVVAAMSDLVTQSLEQRRFTMILLATFAAVALVLTCIGIYGVASYSVSQRTQEIGVRIALGARRANVLALIVRQGASPAIVGLLIGFLLTWWTSKAIASMLFGIGPRDPGSIGAVALLLALVAFAASYIPARRAARVDPVKALRAE
jgi:putative ABC transport system permease protein